MQIKAKQITVSEVGSAKATIAMAESGRVDGAYLGTVIATYMMNEVLEKPGLLVLDESLPHSKNDFTLSTIAHPEVVKQFNEFLDKEKDSIAKLKEKHKIKE